MPFSVVTVSARSCAVELNRKEEEEGGREEVVVEENVLNEGSWARVG